MVKVAAEYDMVWTRKLAEGVVDDELVVGFGGDRVVYADEVDRFLQPVDFDDGVCKTVWLSNAFESITVLESDVLVVYDNHCQALFCFVD